MNFNRRSFLKKNALLGGGLMLAGSVDALGSVSRKINTRFSALKNIHISYTNDLHAQTTAVFDEIGGLDAVSTAMSRKEIKSLLFDAGGFLNANKSIFRNEQAISIMNELDYHGVNLSAKDLEMGIQDLEKLVGLMNFPLISANYQFESPILQAKVHPFVTFQYGKYKVGLTGVGSQVSMNGVQVSDAPKALTKISTLLKEREQCNLVICLTHLGLSNGHDLNRSLAEQSENVDLFIGGHQETQTKGLLSFKNAGGHDVFLSNDHPKGMNLSHLIYTFNADGYKTGVALYQDVPDLTMQSKINSLRNLHNYTRI